MSNDPHIILGWLAKRPQCPSAHQCLPACTVWSFLLTPRSCWLVIFNFIFPPTPWICFHRQLTDFLVLYCPWLLHVFDIAGVEIHFICVKRGTGNCRNSGCYTALPKRSFTAWKQTAAIQQLNGTTSDIATQYFIWNLLTSDIITTYILCNAEFESDFCHLLSVAQPSPYITLKTPRNLRL